MKKLVAIALTLATLSTLGWIIGPGAPTPDDTPIDTTTTTTA
jgi:hypothetical protein